MHFKYFLSFFVLISFYGCGERKVSSHNILSKQVHVFKKNQRNEAMLNKKLSLLQKKKKGVWLSKQQRDVKKEIDSLIRDTTQYNQKVKKFGDLHPYIKRKKVVSKIRKIPEKESVSIKIEPKILEEGGQNASELKYY